MRMTRLGRLTSCFTFSIVVVACGGGDSMSGPDTHLTVTAQTEGTQVDPDGYSVQVGASSPSALGANGSITVNGVATGAVSVTLLSLIHI